jgi:phosphate transport system permease protein
MSRYFTDRISKYAVLIWAIFSFAVLLAIAVFIFVDGLPAFKEVGFFKFLFGTTWSPESGQYGILTMIVGSLAVTIGAMLLAVPFGIGCAILLAEVAPPKVRQIIRPAVELLVGIPSVVYGFVGMLVVVPFVRQIGGSGYSVLAASIVLAAMVLPTIISISEDSIRAVPRRYKEGALAIGATQWQTIWNVLIPTARSGIVAGIILGMGRAIGETMAMIMVIGNSPIMPTSPLDPARTLTGNIVAGANYATGTHQSALFATGVVLLFLIIVLNSVATFVFRKASRASNAY